MAQFRDVGDEQNTPSVASATTPSLVPAPDTLAFDVIYPRALVALTIVFDGGNDVVNTDVIPARVTYVRNQHHTAGTCEVDIGLSALTFGQRVINNIFLAAFVGLAKGPYEAVKSDKNLRFIGYVDNMRDVRSAKGPVVTLKCRDLSAPFRDDKPLVTRSFPDGSKIDPTPKYNDTIKQAIERIFKWTGLDDNIIEISDPYGLGNTLLGNAVAERARNSMLPVKGDSSAWEAIEHIGGMCNVLITVDRGKLVLRQPADIFGETNGVKDPIAYNFVFGLADGNALEVEREKNFTRNRKGVKVVAFDPKKKRSIVAEWPNSKDLAPRKRPKPKHTGASAGHAKEHAAKQVSNVPEDDRDIYDFSSDGVTSKDQALAIAKRIYSERSNQELSGSILTKNITDDLLDLTNGDRINLTVGQRLESELRRYDSTQRKIEFLSQQLGMNEDAARVLLQQTAQEQAVTPYYLRTMTCTWQTSGCEAHVDFINLMLFS